MPSQPPFQTVLLDSSPVSFVITGPGSGHRRVLIRSPDQNLDLVGLDSGGHENRSIKLNRNIFSVLSISPAIDDNLDRFIVRTHPRVGFDPSTSFEDDRTTYFSFAWRGWASVDEIEHIRDMFIKLGPDLEVAIKSKDINAVEWAVSGLIGICHSYTKRHSRRYRRMTQLFYACSVIYAAIIFALLVQIPHSVI